MDAVKEYANISEQGEIADAAWMNGVLYAIDNINRMMYFSDSIDEVIHKMSDFKKELIKGYKGEEDDV